MKAGKALNERKTEVRVQFKPPTAPIHGDAQDLRNELVVSLLVHVPASEMGGGWGAGEKLEMSFDTVCWEWTLLVSSEPARKPA